MNIHALNVIQTYNPSNKAVADPRLRLHSLWDHIWPSGMIKSTLIMDTYAR